MMGAMSGLAGYTQVKVSVKPEIASSFKATCAADGVSMASEISRFMGTYTGLNAPAKPRIVLSADTRGQRRKSVKILTQQLATIMEAERRYMSNIPENLQNSMFYEAAEETVSALQEALDALAEAY